MHDGLDHLVSRAETRKIARLLGVDPADVAYLEACRHEDLAALRMQMTDELFEGEGAALRRAADASKVLPLPLVATIAEKAMGPLLCGRMSGLLAPDRAAGVADRLSPEFLAKVAGETDPRRAIDVISRIDAKKIAATAGFLGRTKEWVAMGRFVAYLDDDALRGAIDALDDEGLIQSAYTLEGKDRLDRLIGLVPDERLAAMPKTAERLGLWPEVVDLLAHLGPEQRDRVRTLGGPEAEAKVLACAAELGVEVR